MTKQEIAAQAYKECCSAETTAHHGGFGRPFWNVHAFQFMYVPSFQFQPIPGCEFYRFSAKDKNGKIHTFDADNPSALLTDIWGDLPEGVVELTVRTADGDGLLVGARTFYKTAPFCAGLPGAVRPYGECASRAFEYIINLDYVRYWLDHGVPDPGYILNAYPSKTHSAIIETVLNSMSLFPDRAADMLKIAKNAADYLLSITPDGGPMNGVPPTYKLDCCDSAEEGLGGLVNDRSDTVMTIYPSYVGRAYLSLEEKTGEKRYLDAALKIGEFYLDKVLESGSWFIMLDSKTGSPVSFNLCDPLVNIVPFLMKLYSRTGDSKWDTLAKNAISYVEKNSLEQYNWEGQFEDSGLSDNYSNLTHFGASALARYYAEYYSDDEARMKTAEELMRFVEDQFVVWEKPAPWNKSGFDTSLFLAPCGLEQYNWHVPIDSSTAGIALSFLSLYKAGRGEIYLEKARALMNSVTRAQREDGMIPTHWMDEKSLAGDNFWVNCMIYTAGALQTMAEFE